MQFPTHVKAPLLNSWRWSVYYISYALPLLLVTTFVLDLLFFTALSTCNIMGILVISRFQKQTFSFQLWVSFGKVTTTVFRWWYSNPDYALPVWWRWDIVINIIVPPQLLIELTSLAGKFSFGRALEQTRTRGKNGLIFRHFCLSSFQNIRSEIIHAFGIVELVEGNMWRKKPKNNIIHHAYQMTISSKVSVATKVGPVLKHLIRLQPNLDGVADTLVCIESRSTGRDVWSLAFWRVLSKAKWQSPKGNFSMTSIKLTIFVSYYIKRFYRISPSYTCGWYKA